MGRVDVTCFAEAWWYGCHFSSACLWLLVGMAESSAWTSLWIYVRFWLLMWDVDTLQLVVQYVDDVLYGKGMQLLCYSIEGNWGCTCCGCYFGDMTGILWLCRWRYGDVEYVYNIVTWEQWKWIYHWYWLRWRITCREKIYMYKLLYKYCGGGDIIYVDWGWKVKYFMLSKIGISRFNSHACLVNRSLCYHM